MLHAVAADPRQEVGDESVSLSFEGGIGAEDVARLANDLLDIAPEGSELGGRAVVVHGDTERRIRGALPERERLQGELPHLARAVHQIGEIRCRIRHLVRPRKQLRRHAPGRTGRTLEVDGGGSVLEAPRPEQRRRHVDMRVSRVDAEIGAVHSIAEHAIGHAHRAVVSGDVPAVGVRLGDRQRLAGAIGGPHIEHVLRELVQRVASRRGAAHAQPERAGRHARKRHRHVHQAMGTIGEGQPVRDRIRLLCRHDRHGGEDGDQCRAGADAMTHSGHANTRGSGLGIRGSGFGVRGSSVRGQTLAAGIGAIGNARPRYRSIVPMTSSAIMSMNCGSSLTASARA